MDLVIRVIDGPDKGQEFPVPPGSHIIGRGHKAAMKLSPEDVSWEHAVLTREGDDYYIENLSALGTWVADSKVTGRLRLRPRDRIRLSGDCLLRLEPVGGGGLLSSRAFLGTLLFIMVGLAVAALFLSGEFSVGGEDAGDDWNAAYTQLAPWLQRQADRNLIPDAAVTTFDRAWRLEQNKDYSSSAKLWLQLQIALASAEKDLHALELAGRDPGYKALNAMLRTEPNRPATKPSDEQLSAAMAQFVERRLKYAALQTKGGILKGD